MEIWGLVVGTTFTLLIFSYLLKDTILYRWSLALLVGCGIGYGLGLAWHHILREWISNAMATSLFEINLFYISPLVLGALLLFKGFSPNRTFGRLAMLGNIPLAFLVGVGTATAVSGALVGTLIPQILATGDVMTFNEGTFGFIQGLIIVCGTVATLLFFSSLLNKQGESGEGNLISRWISRIGQVFVVIALGFTFSGAITSALTALIMRLWKLSDLIRQLISVGGG
jgi:hypothetical protein